MRRRWPPSFRIRTLWCSRRWRAESSSGRSASSSSKRSGGATPPETRLLGIFDAFDEWFHRDDFEGCTFINVLLEMGSQHALGQASLTCLERIRGIVKELADDANLRDVEEFALTFHMLMKGSIIAACEGQKNAARLVKPLAQALIEQHR